MRTNRQAWLGAFLLLLSLAPPHRAHAALPVKGAAESVRLMPPPTQVFTARREYPITTLAITNHAGWRDASGYVNVPESVRVTWHIDSTGEAILQARDAWDANASWRELGHWGHNGQGPKQGEQEIDISGPTLLWLRVRAAKFPHSGISRLAVEYRRRTVAVLHGTPGAVRHPVIVAEGYDPFNEEDWNDPGWQEDTAFAKLISRGHEKYNTDTWVVDWGDGGAALEQQAEDFTEIARQVHDWNGGQKGTVAAGISMGAISVRYALALAADRKEDLGIRKYVSINGPHQGAWVSQEFIHFLLGRAKLDPSKEPAEQSETYLVRHGLDNPAARELLIGGAEHDRFYADLRSHGKGGYDPAIQRVAFSNGALVTQGDDLAELVRGKNEPMYRILIRPLWIPGWITFHVSNRKFEYGGYPGELLPTSLRMPTKEHIRFFGIFRIDLRAHWEKIPTFIPTHSALDFPEELVGGPRTFRYNRWRESAFPKFYVSPGRNLPHDQTEVNWIDPRTGKGAPNGENPVLYEIGTGAMGAETPEKAARPQPKKRMGQGTTRQSNPVRQASRRIVARLS